MTPNPALRMVPADTAEVWRNLAPLLPPDLYLGGGTALAVHLEHRVSRDLDFFFHEHAVDLDALERRLAGKLELAVTARAPGTLNGLISKTPVQFLHADEGTPQRRLDEPSEVAGLRIAGLRDLLAMKLKVVGDRGELRDYFDLMKIEEAGLQAEQGLGYFLARFQPNDPHRAVEHVLLGLGYMGDVEDDLALPVKRAVIASYWRRRQPQIIRMIDRTGIRPVPPRSHRPE